MGRREGRQVREEGKQRVKAERGVGILSFSIHVAPLMTDDGELSGARPLLNARAVAHPEILPLAVAEKSGPDGCAGGAIEGHDACGADIVQTKAHRDLALASCCLLRLPKRHFLRYTSESNTKVSHFEQIKYVNLFPYMKS